MGIAQNHICDTVARMTTGATVTDLRQRLRTHRGRYRELSRHGVSYSWITKFATGKRGSRPAFETLRRLAEALDELDATDGRTGAAAKAGALRYVCSQRGISDTGRQ